MRFLALATDYDGTIAQHGHVSDSTIAALERLQESGRKLILVTGREMPDLLKTFSHAKLFDWIVAENGALLYHPATETTKTLSVEAPKTFVDLLRECGVHPLSVGRGIVATSESYKEVVLQAIKQLGLELQVILNKGALMILPYGVDKATGLLAALSELEIPPAAVIGVGDAENDVVLAKHCGLIAAVSNAIPLLKRKAGFVTPSSHGAGVEELIEMILADTVPR